MGKRNGGLVRAGDLFSKYRLVLRAPQRSVERETQRVVGEVCKLNLPTTTFSYTVATRVIFVKAPAPIKAEILLNADEILLKLKNKLGAKNTPRAII
jgi:hypothetical protein